MIKVVLANVLRNKRRSSLTLLGVLVGVAAIISLVSISVGLTERSTSVLSEFQGIFVTQSGGIGPLISSVDEDLISRIESVPGVELVVPEIWGNANDIEGASDGYSFTNFIMIVGIDPEAAGDYNIAPYYRVDDGRSLTSSDNKAVVVGSGLADMFDLFVGSTMKINNENYELIGIFETDAKMMNFMVVTTIDTAREVTDFEDGMVSAFQAIPNNPEDLTSIKRRIDSRFEGELQAMSMQESADIISGFIGNLNIALWFVSGIAGLVGGIGVMNTMLMSVMERIQEFGVLKAVGWRDRDVMIMIVLESLLLSFIGGIMGVGLGFVVSNWVTSVIDIPSVINLELIGQAMFFALTLGLVGGVYPAYKSSKMSPIEAVRG